ncbi:hypothetical protein C2138_05045 [Salinibacterium hongtaonis]|nr:hypothetical protein C2138_05045 [Salinibacterium hongtaonis]
MPSDVEISLNGDASATLSRTVAVVDENGESNSITASIGQIAAPWAVDANGRQIDTHYELVGNELIQVVEHNQPGVAYPVVADPTFWWGWNVYFSNNVVNQVVKLVLAGAAATVLASRIIALVPGVGAVAVNVTALAGALITFGAAALNVCNYNNRGVYVGYTWVTGVLPFAPVVYRLGYFCVPN